MKIIAGSAHPELANKISKHLGQELTAVELARFPDGEIFVKVLENIRGHDVFIIQPTCPPANENIMELLLLIDACRRASALRIIAVIPYYGYARQDRKDQPRVPISAKLVANLLVAAGVSRILAMDFHSEQLQGFFDIPVDHLYAYPVIVKYLRSKKMKNRMIVAPDPGSVKAADHLSSLLKAGLAFVAKRRINPEEVEALNVVGEVKGYDCIMVDDITSTAKTLCASAEILKEKGARSITAAVTHTLLNQDGIKRLGASPITEFISTDSLPMNAPKEISFTLLSIAELLGDAMLRIYNNQSVTSLFKV